MTSKEIIDKLASPDYSKTKEKDIIKLIQHYGRAGAIITTLHPSPHQRIPPNLFVRASIYDPKNETNFSICRLTYPPLHFNVSYQRASTPSSPMFYGTRHKSINQPDVNSAIKTCLLETIDDYQALLDGNKRVLVSLWYVLFDIHLYCIFNWKEFQQKNNEMQEICEEFNTIISNSQDKEMIENTKLILDFLADRFKIPVNHKNKYDYMPSGVLSQYLINRLNTELKMYDKEVDGIIFPSVQVKGQELNVAIVPATADNKLVCAKVMDCAILDNKKIRIEQRANIPYGGKHVHFNEKCNILIDLN